MRGFWCVVASFCVAFFLSGCDSLDSRYIREGIGTDLYWDGLPAATQLQDVYLANICAQAISPTARSAGADACEGLSLRNRDWGLLVQAGMNDIDLRCDAYLQWLHDKRSSREPVLKQMAALGGATAAILRATEVSATPIALAGIAFGLAAETFTNVDLRILNGVDYTTVQSVVRGNRTDFRQNNLKLVIDNRPAAIYVLRTYLSICTPASIEMSINNTINVYHRGGPGALVETPIGLRLPAATAATSAAIRGQATAMVREPPIVTPPVAMAMGHPIGPVEASISLSSGKLLQRALCATETGDFDRATRDQLRQFNAGIRDQAASVASDTLATDADLSRLRASQRRFPSCQNAGFSNAYEVGLFSRYSAGDMQGYINAALAKAGLAQTVTVGVGSGQTIDASVRQAVTALRAKYNLPGRPVFDKTFFDTMLGTISN
jgi:hypothetical protein